MSAAGRARIAAAQKARWAKVKKVEVSPATKRGSGHRQPKLIGKRRGVPILIIASFRENLTGSDATTVPPATQGLAAPGFGLAGRWGGMFGGDHPEAQDDDASARKIGAKK
jgi:hypothetical protein